MQAAEIFEGMRRGEMNMAEKYHQVTPEILEQFKAIVPGKVYAGGEINSDYFHDEMPIYGKGVPEVLIEATTTEDIAAIMKVCYENCIPVIPSRNRSYGCGCGSRWWCHDRHEQDEQDPWI